MEQVGGQSWSIVIFCFNEVGTVAQIIADADRVLKEMNIEVAEILVVDDGSTDGSQAEIKKTVPNFERSTYIFHDKNKGIGHALRTGYFNANYENICAVPADGQFDLNELKPFSSIAANSFISFFRKENTSYSLFRNILSIFNKTVNQILNGFNLLDVNWVKIYKREAILALNLQIESSLVESEICAKLLKSDFEVKQIQSKYLERKSGESKGSSFKIVLQALKDTLLLSKVLWSFKPIK
ncbi:MAG: glycosyltransferase family 2 protein [Bacteroidota bacterium]